MQESDNLHKKSCRSPPPPERRGNIDRRIGIEMKSCRGKIRYTRSGKREREGS